MQLKKQGGIMPEDLPTPKKSLKELEKEINNLKKRQVNERVRYKIFFYSFVYNQNYIFFSIYTIIFWGLNGIDI